MPEVFLSYRRGKPDEDLADMLHSYLQLRGVDVFLDREDIPLGADWDRVIGAALDSAAFLVILVSDRSALSDFVKEELRRAHEQRKRILPIRLGSPNLSPHFGAILNPIQGAVWNGDSPFECICENIHATVRVAQGAPLPDAIMESGTVPLDSPFYVRRREDDLIERELSRGRGRTIVIKGPRQCGKSSLLLRAHAFAQERGCHSWYLDFQKHLDSAHLATLESLFYSLAIRIQRAFSTTLQVKDVWDPQFGVKSSLEDFIERAVLERATSNVVFCFDEVDRVFAQDYHTDFFSALRGWHNTRAERLQWRKFSLVLAHSTDPSLWIAGYDQSPFNIGDEGGTLSDFRERETEFLNLSYGTNLASQQLNQLLAFTGGHPYLTRLAMYTMKTEKVSIEQLQERAVSPDGPFGAHLRHHSSMLNRKPQLAAALRQVLNGGHCESDTTFHELYAAGLVSGQSLNRARIRCDLYQRYFEEHL